MTTAFQRLLKYPHAAVFDKDPVADLALRIRHPDGAAWAVADEKLTVTAGELVRTYDLATLTVGQLAVALQADGFEVPAVASQWASRSAMVLAEARGNQYESNGDRVQAFTSLLWALLSSYAGEIREAERQVREALKQMVLTTAEGEWLDLWGTLYAVPRNEGEVDAAYAPRIAKEVFRKRVNARAIELAIRDLTGFDVRIHEPWMDIFTLDQSLLSGPDKMYDGKTVGYHLIQPRARGSINWPAVRAVIDRNRAAGVMVLSPEIYRTSQVTAPDPVIHSIITHLKGIAVLYEDRTRLDYMAIEDVSIPNHKIRRVRHLKYASLVEVPTSNYFAYPAKASRDGRVFRGIAVYEGQYWSMLGDMTWDGSGGGTWSDFTPLVKTGHTRES